MPDPGATPLCPSCPPPSSSPLHPIPSSVGIQWRRKVKMLRHRPTVKVTSRSVLHPASGFCSGVRNTIRWAFRNVPTSSAQLTTEIPGHFLNISILSSASLFFITVSCRSSSIQNHFMSTKFELLSKLFFQRQCNCFHAVGNLMNFD